MKLIKRLMITLCCLGLILSPSFLASAKEEKVVEVSPKAWENAAIVEVKNTYLNIRKEASKDSEVIGGLFKGDKVEIIKKQADWLEIKSGEIQGFIHSDYILTGEKAFAYALENELYKGKVKVDKALLYTVNDQKETVIEHLVKDQEVQVIGYSGSVLKVRVEEGKEGIVKAEDLDLRLEISVASAKADLAERIQEERKKQNTNLAISATPEEIALMAAIIQCEAGGEIYEGKLAVGAVIMNRLNSPVWPNTLREVIYQPGQFEPAMTGWLDQVLAQGARQDCIDAAIEALNGANPIGEYYYFHAGGGAGLTIGNQTFH